MTLDDALFNWLQMKHVAKERPDDEAAQETYQFFQTMLEEDHQVQHLEASIQEPMYVIRYVHKGKRHEKTFPVEFVHQLLHDIQSEPKYNESF